MATSPYIDYLSETGMAPPPAIPNMSNPLNYNLDTSLNMQTGGFGWYGNTPTNQTIQSPSTQNLPPNTSLVRTPDGSWQQMRMDEGADPFFGRTSGGDWTATTNPDVISEWKHDQTTRGLQSAAQIAALIGGGTLASNLLGPTAPGGSISGTGTGGGNILMSGANAGDLSTLGWPVGTMPAGSTAAGNVGMSTIGNLFGWESGAGVGKNLLGMLTGAMSKPDGGGVDWMKVLGAIGGLGAAGGGNDLSDLLGLTNRNLTNQLKEAQFTAPNVGLSGGVHSKYDPTTNTYRSSVGDLAPIREMLLGSAANSGQDPVIQKALRDFGLGSFAGTGDVEAQQLALLRERAAPEQQRRDLNAINNLFSRGRYGSNDSQSGEIARQLSEARGQEDLGFQLAARDLGLRTQQQRFGQGLSSLGLFDQNQGSALTRLLGASGGVQDLTKLSALPIEMQLALGIGRSNAALGVGSNLVKSSADSNSLGDLLGLFMRSGGTA